MSWKDELRKAPFDIGQEKDVQFKNREADRKKLLEDLDHMLSKYVDKPLREQINRYPQGNQFRVAMAPQIKEFLQKLQGAGISDTKLETRMAIQYKANRVTIGDDRFIFYMKEGY